MATASQKMILLVIIRKLRNEWTRRMVYLTKFFDLILGALTAAPTKLVPVMKIPLMKINDLPLSDKLLPSCSNNRKA